MYSRSRYMNTRLRTLRAVPSQLNRIIAMPMVRVVLSIIMAISVM